MNIKRDTILIVDDKRFNLNVLKDLLDPYYDTMVAKNGDQALKRVISETPPDLVLLDIMMPGMDGFQVLKRLKADNATKNIPVIFVTAMGDTTDETKGLELGAVDYITKPISPPKVLARVRTQLALKKSLEEQLYLNQKMATLNNDLVNKNAELTDLNQLKNKFLGMAAHDLRNPLTSIMGFSQLIMKMTLPEEKKTKFLENINQASRQMLKLVNDLLDVSVIESGVFKLQLEAGNLSKLAEERAELMQFKAKDKDIELETKLSNVPETSFDADRLSQVIDNLLTNAFKFSYSGSTVQLTTYVSDDNIAISVTDQGQGIPDDEISQLFGSFQKLSVRPTGGEKSTGLGLSIVNKIVAAHSGEIKVESEVGKGTTFTILLPIEQPV